MKIEIYSPTIRRKEMDAVLNVLVEEKIGPGEQAVHLVQLAKEALNFDYSLALRSPATALGLALKSFKSRSESNGGGGAAEQKKDAVLVSALSPSYYAKVIEDAGMELVIADVHPGTACLSARTIKDAMERAGADYNFVCVVLNETLGFLPDFNSPPDETAEVAENGENAPGGAGAAAGSGAPLGGSGAAGGASGAGGSSGAGAVSPNSVLEFSSGLPLIEDCSASFGSCFASGMEDAQGDSQGGAAQTTQKAGNFGTLSILGLEERDFITAGGGALLFSTQRKNSPALRSFSALPAVYGIPDMNAAMGFIQLKEAKRNSEKRAAIAALYRDAAMHSRHRIIAGPWGFQYNNYAFPLILETGMKDVEAYARKKEIAVEPAFSNTLIGESLSGGGQIPGGQIPGGASLSELFPNAYSLALRTILFPIYPRLGEAAAHKVARLIQTLP